MTTVRQFRIAAVFTGVMLFAFTLLYSAPRYADFATLYVGGRILDQGNVSRLYDLNEQARVYEQSIGERSPLIDPYPPFDAVLFAPFARLDYRTAFVVWSVANILLWLFSLLLLRGWANSIQPSHYLMLYAAFPPLWVALLLGQMSLVLLTAFGLTYVFLRRGQEYRAGIALGLGLVKFQIVLPLALIFLIRRRWKFIAGFVAVGVFLGVLSLAVVGLSGARAYVKLLVDILGHPANPLYQSIKPLDMPTIRGFVTGVLIGHVQQRWITALWVTLSAGLILFTASRWTNESDFDLMYASILVVSLLSAIHLLPYDLTPALVGVVLVIASRKWRERSKAKTLLTFAIGTLYASLIYLAYLVRHQAFFVLAPVLLIFALGTLALARKGRQEDLLQNWCIGSVPIPVEK